MRFQPTFPSFFAVDQLDTIINNDAVIDCCYDLHSKDVAKTQGGWSSGYLPHSLLENELKELNYQIEVRIIDIKKTLGIKSNVIHRISNFWINILEPNSTRKFPPHPPHIHGGQFLSCVYYPKANLDSGNLTLMTPFHMIEHVLSHDLLEDYNMWNSGHLSVTPEPGKLIIFPAWIMHYVQPNYSDQDRISIAFNISLEH